MASKEFDQVKLLFICSRNQWRSPTAERLFDGFSNYAARSAGTEKGARVKVTAGHVGCISRDFRDNWTHATGNVSATADQNAFRMAI